jgi:branched-chain amino acid transport system ATP-binding protein
MSEHLLHVQNLTAGYRTIRILHEVEIKVPAGAIVAVIGPNGAGKTTLARSLAGFTHVFGGELSLLGKSMTNLPPEIRPRMGVASVPEGRRLFPALTLEQNLELAEEAR